MTDIEDVKRVLAEAMLRLIRIEECFELLMKKNPNMNLPTQQEILDINMKAMKDVVVQVPWATWLKVD